MTETTPTAARRAFLARIKHSDLPDADKVTVLAIVRKAMSARKPKPKPLTPAQARWAAKTDAEKSLHGLKTWRGNIHSALRFSEACDKYHPEWTTPEDQVRRANMLLRLENCEDRIFEAENFLLPVTQADMIAAAHAMNDKCGCGRSLLEGAAAMLDRHAPPYWKLECAACLADREAVLKRLWPDDDKPSQSTLRRERKAKRMLRSVGIEVTS